MSKMIVKYLTLNLILFTSMLFSQDLPSDKYWRSGSTHAICVQGDTLLSQNGYILEVFNITDKSNPEWISSIQLPNKFSKIEIWNNYAFCLLSSKQLAVIDLNNLLSLKLINLFESEINDFTFYKEKLILARGEFGFSIYDMVDISTPKKIENYNFEDSYILKKVRYTQEYLYFSSEDKIIIFNNSDFPGISLYKIIDLDDLIEERVIIYSFIPTDNYVYASLYNKGIVTLDLSDTSNITAGITKYGGSNDASYNDMILYKDYLLAATSFYQIYDTYGLHDYFGDGIHVFDISDKSKPNDYCKIHFSKYHYSSSFMMTLSSDENILISPLGYLKGFRFMDITLLNDAKEIGVSLNPTIKDISFSDNIIYYAGGRSGLGILNNSTDEISEIKRIIPNGAVTTCSKVGNNLFVGIDSLGIQIYSLTDPINPVPISLIPSGQPNFIYTDQFILTWDGFSIKIYDITDIVNPKFITEFCYRTTWEEQISNVFYFKNFIIVVPEDDAEPYEIFDLTKLKNPESVYQMKLKSYSTDNADFQKTNGYLYVRDYNNNYIYNVSDLKNIKLVRTNYFPQESNAVIRGDTLYLQSDKLSIYNVSDLSNPELLSSFNFPLTWNFKLQDNILFHRNGPYGTELEIFRINNINDVELILTLPITEDYFDLRKSKFYNNELISYAAWRIEIFNFKNITNVEEKSDEKLRDYKLKNYPNPLNSSTNINYSLPKGENVQIYLYNVLGEEIDKLVDGYKEAGYHSIRYNADHLSSGIYFFRLISESKSLLTKMIVMK